MSFLEMRDVRKGFRDPRGGERPVVDIAHFGVAAGQHVVLVGGSGSGKTTVLHLAAGVLLPDSGSVRLDGVELGQLSEARRDRHRGRTIGYLFQTFNLLQGLSALENVVVGMSFAGRPDAARARALLERLGLGDRLADRPRQLSVGQQQRVALARALAHRPGLVLADEPTSSLDPTQASTALALLREQCELEGAALLLVTHAPAVVAQFTDVRELSAINRAAELAEPAGPTAAGALS